MRPWGTVWSVVLNVALASCVYGVVRGWTLLQKHRFNGVTWHDERLQLRPRVFLWTIMLYSLNASTDVNKNSIQLKNSRQPLSSVSAVIWLSPWTSYLECRIKVGELELESLLKPMKIMFDWIADKQRLHHALTWAARRTTHVRRSAEWIAWLNIVQQKGKAEQCQSTANRNQTRHLWNSNYAEYF